MIKVSSNFNNKTIAEYLKNNILSSYLIHVEFELLNIQSSLTTDLNLNRLIKLRSESIDMNNYHTLIEGCLIAIRELIRIHRVD